MMQYIRVDGADIERIVDRIENVIEGEKNVNVAIACLVVAITAQNPKMEMEEVQETVKQTSEWLAAYLSGVDGVVH